MDGNEAYKNWHENRSSVFKDMVKTLLILGVGFVGFVLVLIIGLEWLQSNAVAQWIAWGLWIFSHSWVFDRLRKEKIENQKLRERNEELINRLIEAPKPQVAFPAPTATIKSGLSVANPDPDIDDVILQIEENLDSYSFNDFKALESKYKQSQKFRDKSLNWTKFWTRGEKAKQRDRSKTKQQIRREEAVMNKMKG